MTVRRNVPRSTVALLPVAALALALTACGGGVSKSAYVKKADAACAPGNATAAAAAKPSNLPDLATAAGTIATTVDAQAVALRTLSAPGGDKAVVAGVVGALADVGGPARALQTAAAGKTDDRATAQAVTDLKAKADAAAAQAQSYGLNACAKGLQPAVTSVVDGGRTILKAAFVARAESLCTAASKKADALTHPTSLASTAKYLTSYVPIEEKLFADIKALVAPPGDDATVADMLGAQQQVIDKDKASLAAAQKGNTSLFFSLSDEESSLVTAANSKFDGYGLKMCGTLSSF
jgi:hypothetical protein